MKIKSIIRRITHVIHYYYILYADSTELLEKAQKLLRPLPEGCELIRLTSENKDSYKCKDLVDKMLQVGGEVWVVVNKENEIIAWHYGTYRDNTSLFFNVKKCDFEHVELKVDERYRRNGIALYLLYHTVKNLNFKDVRNKKLGTCIRPDNIPSMKLHEIIGFKKSHRVVLLHWMRRKKDGYYSFLNIPRYSI